MKGFEILSTIVGFNLSIPYPYTILFRTNAELLSQAVEMLEDGRKLNIEVDMSDFVKSLQSAVALYKRDMRNIKHEDIIPFNTWEELKTEGKGNGELTRLAKIVESGEALRYIDMLEQHYNTDSPEITLTTAHRSKGREWDNVILAEDFPSCYDKDGKFVGMDSQERNLLYVASTRAKKMLQYNFSVTEMIEATDTLEDESNHIERLLARKLRSQHMPWDKE